jgi:multiple sugar transport system substrate-binding protein
MEVKAMQKHMGKLIAALLSLLALVLAGCAAPAAPAATGGESAASGEAAAGEAAGETGDGEWGPFSPGRMVVFDYGQPQYWQQFFEMYLEAHPDLAPGVTVEMVQTEGEADARQKVVLSYTAGAMDELPDAVASAPVSMKAMAEGGILMDITEYVEGFADRLAPGALDQLYYNGRIYCLPKDLRPQLLFYNNAIFEEYGIDPARMSTIEGWIEVGRELKEASGGEVFLSYIEPGLRTWRYYGRRGLMPQANARIWDDEGNVVIDTDPGARLAFETLETMHDEGLLFSATVFDPPLYEATRQDKIAT